MHKLPIDDTSREQARGQSSDERKRAAWRAAATWTHAAFGACSTPHPLPSSCMIFLIGPLACATHTYTDTSNLTLRHTDSQRTCTHTQAAGLGTDACAAASKRQTSTRAASFKRVLSCRCRVRSKCAKMEMRKKRTASVVCVQRHCPSVVH